ncbi:Chromosome partition protein Smc [compost metagenome]
MEQFGDNFKALNESVGKMNEWQELYKQHVEALEERIELAINELERTATANEAISRSLSSSEQSIGSIDNHCQSIPTAIGQLEPVLQVNQHQIQELQRHLDAFVAMRDQATSAVPQLQLHMETLSGQLAEGMKGVMTTMHEGAQEFGRSVDLTNAALTESAHVVSSRSEQIAENMQDAAQEFGSSVRANRTMGAVEAQVREATERASASLHIQLNAMDQAIGRELEKVFKEMGSALATISRRIADDHAELAQRVRA